MMETLFDAATWILPLILAIVFHEVAHGWTARFFGDPTADQLGRLSLNPIRHVDPLGTIIVPGILALASAPMFGWAKPVPVNFNRLRNPRWHMVAVAAAGPLSNIIMAIIGCVLLFVLMPAQLASTEKLDSVTEFVFANFHNFVIINLFLAVFNMLPIPPFDGSKVLAGILPPKLGAKVHAADKYAIVFMIVFLFLIPQYLPQLDIIRPLVGAPVNFLYEALITSVGSIFGPA